MALVRVRARSDSLDSGEGSGLRTSNSLAPAMYYGTVYYLPIYFQAVNGASAMLSAVYLLPMIISQLVTAGASDVVGSKIGYVIAVAVFSTVFLSIGSGLYSFLQPGTPSGQWLGFQIRGRRLWRRTTIGTSALRSLTYRVSSTYF
ncbi:hypothetical protein F5Y06DRAFT_236645 [Hypoxylon sp. FL0890]|nr:hypothetical protein F5Y06DRAFT_236645 [Hypoxylon sp. FL0890]